MSEIDESCYALCLPLDSFRPPSGESKGEPISELIHKLATTYGTSPFTPYVFLASLPALVQDVATAVASRIVEGGIGVMISPDGIPLVKAKPNPNYDPDWTGPRAFSCDILSVDSILASSTEPLPLDLSPGDAAIVAVLDETPDVTELFASLKGLEGVLETDFYSSVTLLRSPDMYLADITEAAKALAVEGDIEVKEETEDEGASASVMRVGCLEFEELAILEGSVAKRWAEVDRVSLV